MPPFVQPSPEWLLLVACAAVQFAISTTGARAGMLAVSLATASYLALVVRLQPVGVNQAAMLLCFWVASAAILWGDRLARARIQRLNDLCDTDEGTGCLSRRGFASRLEAVVNESVRMRTMFTLIALDVDHFKQINDRYGHLAGDGVLAEVGRTLVDTVARDGFVARLGGEEFAVLLPNADEEAGGVMAERVLASLRDRRFESLPSDARVTMSAGIASESPTDARITPALRARADEALYAAKRSGRDRALLWPPGVHSNATPAMSSQVIPPPGKPRISLSDMRRR